MWKYPSLLLLLLTGVGAQAGELGLGRVATDAEIAAWDTDVRPDGTGLPAGGGSVLQGEEVYAEKCAVCHGDFGEGVGRWPVLAGGADTLDSDDPVKTVGSYWPYLSTVYDYINRAMPFGAARTLDSDEIYAITAYILYLNDIVDDENFVLEQANFSAMRLPNEANFSDDARPDTELLASQLCMRDCKQNVRVTKRARALDVTPVSTESATADAVAAVTASVQSAPTEIPAAVRDTVDTVCASCHVAGVANAPRFGDREAWDQRASTGLAALVKSVVAGKGAMPPGGGANLTPDQLELAIHYMMQKQ